MAASSSAASARSTKRRGCGGSAWSRARAPCRRSRPPWSRSLRPASTSRRSTWASRSRRVRRPRHCARGARLLRTTRAALARRSRPKRTEAGRSGTARSRADAAASSPADIPTTAALSDSVAASLRFGAGSSCPVAMDHSRGGRARRFITDAARLAGPLIASARLLQPSARHQRDVSMSRTNC